jgi:hypothetical protein
MMLVPGGSSKIYEDSFGGFRKRGYHPEPAKSILVVQWHKFKSAKLDFENLNFKVTPGSRSLGGFLGDPTKRDEWLAEKTSFWASAIVELAVTARLYPQSAYTGLQRSLQQEWQYVQRVVGNMSGSFSEVEKVLRSDFIPAMFREEQEVDDGFRTLLGLPVKQAGIALPDLTISGPANHRASILVCSYLLAAFRGQAIFSTTDHFSVRKEVFQELKRRKAAEYLTTLASSLILMPVETRRTIRKGKETGMWLTLAPFPPKNSGIISFCDTIRDPWTFPLIAMDAWQSLICAMPSDSRKEG